MIIDSHTHLNTDQLFLNWKSLIQKFQDSGGKILINAGANNFYNEKGIQIAKESTAIFPELTVKTTIGWHPCDIPHNEKDFYNYITELQELYINNRDFIVAVGECGIDLHFPENPSITVQQNALRKQAELARCLNLPLMIHSRDGFKETMEVLKDFSDLKIYFHARGYGIQELEEAENIFPRLRIGCTNVIEYPSATKIREAITNIKTAKILTETDAPFLPPQCFRGQQNEPAYVLYVYQKLSEILNIPEKELKYTIHNNINELFFS